MEKKAWEHEFVVRGTGPFPFDMLRFDECWPAGIEDAAAIEALASASVAEVRNIILHTHKLTAPTHKRWESFCWTVLFPRRRLVPTPHP